MNEQQIRTVLLDAGVPKGTEITLRIRMDTLADVYVNGMFYNTMDTMQNTLLLKNTNIEAEALYHMHVEIALNAKGHANEIQSLEIELPARPEELEDMLDRAGIESVASVKWLEQGQAYLGRTALNMLNILAVRLNRMDAQQYNLYTAYLQQMEDCSNLIKLIEFTYNMGCGHLLEGITTDTELGEYSVEHQMIDQLDNLPQEVRKYIDYGKIGEEQRNEKHGIFVQGGYFSMDMNAYKSVLKDEDICEEDYSVIRTLPYEKTNGCCLPLPASDAALEQFLNECPQEFQLYSVIPNLSGFMAEIQELNTFAKDVMEVRKNGQFPKLKAWFELYPPVDLQDAQKRLHELDTVQIYPQIRTKVEYAQYLIEKQIPFFFNVLQQFIDFSKFADKVLAGAVCGESAYGVLVKRNAVEQIMKRSEG